MAPKTKVLLVGIDGLMLARAIDSGRARTLSKLRENSFFTETVVDLPTLSGPSWSTYLTGTRQDKHKVVNNLFIDHNLVATPDLLTKAKSRNPELITYAAAGWPPLIDPNDLGPVIAEGSHIRFARDGETHGYLKIDHEVYEHAIETMQDIGPHLSFVYFCGVDEAGHRHGTLFGPYFDAIERIDGYIESLQQVIRVRAEKFDEKWLMVLITDHGHRDEGGHGGDTPQERASFVLAHGIGRSHPNWPTELAPHDLADLLITEVVH